MSDTIEKLYAQDDIEKELNTSAAWTTTLGDLMSNLMILFLALLSFYIAVNFTPGLFSQNMGSNIAVTLKEPIPLPYTKDNPKENLDRTLERVVAQIPNSKTEIKIMDDLKENKVRKGLYNIGVVRKVVIFIDRPRGDEDFYIVKKGDTLWKISGNYLYDPVRYKDVAKASKIKNPDLIYPEDYVAVPKASGGPLKVAFDKAYAKAEKSINSIIGSLTKK